MPLGGISAIITSGLLGVPGALLTGGLGQAGNAGGTVPVVSSGNVSGTVGTPIASFQVVATGSPTGYAVVSGTLPSGLILNLVTGVISGTPIASGAGVVIGASNAAGPSTTNGTITFTVSAGGSTTLGIAAHIDYNLVWREANTYWMGARRPAKWTVSRADGQVMDTPTAGHVTMYDATGTLVQLVDINSNVIGGQIAPDLSTTLAVPTLDVAANLSYFARGKFVVELFLQIGDEILTDAQTIQVS